MWDDREMAGMFESRKQGMQKGKTERMGLGGQEVWVSFLCFKEY